MARVTGMKILRYTVCLLFTCLSFPLAEGASYRLIGEHALDIGNQWTYQIHITLENSVPVDKWETQTESITGTKNISGHLTKIAEITDSTGTGYEYYDLTNDYLLDYGYDDNEGMHVIFINNNPGEVAPVWINTTDNNRLLGTGDYQLQMDDPYMVWTTSITSYITYVKQETVTVPAGTFDCIVVINRNVYSDSLGFQMEFTTTTYVDPEVGIIKEEDSSWFYNPYDGQTYYDASISNLTSFTYGNPPPQISSVTATPSTILDNQTSQLQVIATDSSPLSYDWTVLPGQGTLDDYTSPAPLYTPPDTTSPQQTFTITVDVSDGSRTSSSSVDITVIDINSITCDFYPDAFIDFLDFVILADYFAGGNCTEPNWCKGTDVDHSGNTDFSDLSVFTECWLSEAVDPNLVAYWPMDDNDSTAFVSDISGNGHNGTATVNTSILSVPGQVDTCFDFAGTDAVEVDDHPELSFDDSGNNPFSISAWIYVTNTGTNQVILSKYRASTENTREWHFKLGTTLKLQFLLYDEANNKEAYAVIDDALSVDSWHHVVATYDSSGGSSAVDGIAIYVDGSYVDVTASTASGYTSMVNTGTKVVMGADYNSDGSLTSFFGDKIDNVHIFSECLTTTEITVLYGEGL